MNDSRAVVDTNVVLASRRSRHAASPTREVLARWRAGEFVWCFSEDILTEYTEKLLELGVGKHDVGEFLRSLRLLGERIQIEHFHFRHYPVDADDIAFLLCARNGAASHLVTYDDDLLALRSHYLRQFVICGPLEFLRELRATVGGRTGDHTD